MASVSKPTADDQRAGGLAAVLRDRVAAVDPLFPETLAVAVGALRPRCEAEMPPWRSWARA
jgi:hypothetical protein